MDKLIIDTKTKNSIDRRIFLVGDCSDGKSANHQGMSQIITQMQQFSIRLDVINLKDSERGKKREICLFTLCS